MKYVIGIDEVGRGALAGPVTVAATLLSDNLLFKIKNSGLKMRDSKKLSPQQRAQWFQYLKNHIHLAYALASASPAVIDRINISQAANLAAQRAFNRLIQSYEVPLHKNLKSGKIKILLDGGLRLNKNVAYKTIIKGDEKIPAIMLASIIAKVSRDRLMVGMNKKYRLYCFNRHKGYGTKRHFQAIKKYGLSPIHRLTFVSKSHKL